MSKLNHQTHRSSRTHPSYRANRTRLTHRTAQTGLPHLPRLTRLPRLTHLSRSARFSLMALVILMIVLVKIVLLRHDSGWVDLPDPPPEISQPTMNIDQIALSLKDVLKEYESLPTSANAIDKNSLIAKLQRLYRLSAQDYENTAALRETGNSTLLSDLSQSGSLLTSSIFERKDSLAFPGSFGQTQLQASKTDLAAAVSAIARVEQQLKH
ncbi:hypothetical protein CEB3_c45060 [Peptococcaceae bacterium CEB3]|nr:hypothetical protein CEB3_c45060 [Peptococcaceae bacterium CEB3]